MTGPGGLEELLTAVREISDTVVAGEADRCDEKAEWHKEGFKALQEAGIAGMLVPEEHGGLGHGLYALTRVSEILAYQSASMGISFGMHNVATAVIAAKATPDQADRYLRPIAEGRHITTLALSEPGTGVHFYFPRSALVPDEDGYSVTGTKSFSTNGGHADSYVVSTMAADPDAPEGIFSCVLLPDGADGVRWDKPYAGLGMRGNSARTFHMDGVHVPKNDLLGAEGDQMWYVFNVIAPYFLVAMAGTYLGVAQRALEEAKAHLDERAYDHSGRTLQDVQLLQHRLGRMWGEVEHSRQFTYWAAQEAERGGDKALPALASAKARVAETVVMVTNEAMTLCGGRAYRDGALLGRLLRDARAAHVMAPTTDLLWTWTGRAVLGIPLLGDE